MKFLGSRNAEQFVITVWILVPAVGSRPFVEAAANYRETPANSHGTPDIEHRLLRFQYTRKPK